MRTRWVVAMFLGLALLTSQIAPLTVGPLAMGHMMSVFARDGDKGGSGDNGDHGKNKGDGTGAPGMKKGLEK